MSLEESESLDIINNGQGSNNELLRDSNKLLINEAPIVRNEV